MKMISILTKILAVFVMLGCFSLPAFAANAMHIVINNHLGAPEMLIDENRHVVWQAEYDEFGKATILVEEVVFNHRLPGQYYDKETGLHYNYYRDYDPSTGRYVESDPIGLAGGINTYGYVGGNPVSYVDPYGLSYSDTAEMGGLLSLGGGLALLDGPLPVGDIIGASVILGGGIYLACSANSDDKAIVKPGIADAEPTDLCEQLALAAAQAGAGTVEMTSLADEPRLIALYGKGPWVKKRYVHNCPNGKKLVIHYFSNGIMNVELKFVNYGGGVW